MDFHKQCLAFWGFEASEAKETGFQYVPNVAFRTDPLLSPFRSPHENSPYISGMRVR